MSEEFYDVISNGFHSHATCFSYVKASRLDPLLEEACMFCECSGTIDSSTAGCHAIGYNSKLMCMSDLLGCGGTPGYRDRGGFMIRDCQGDERCPFFLRDATIHAVVVDVSDSEILGEPYCAEHLYSLPAVQGHVKQACNPAFVNMCGSAVLYGFHVPYKLQTMLASGVPGKEGGCQPSTEVSSVNGNITLKNNYSSMLITFKVRIVNASSVCFLIGWK